VLETLDRDLESNKTYFYRMMAINQGGSSAASNIVNGTTRAVNLPPVAALTLIQDSNRILLSWNDSGPNESGYRVHRRLPGMATYEVIAFVGPNETSFDDPYHLLLEEKVEYQVVAFNATQESVPVWASTVFEVKKLFVVHLPLLKR